MRKKPPQPDHRCGQCRHAHSPHEIGYDGKPFLCRCPHYTAGRYSLFLKDRACPLFQPRPGGKTLLDDEI